MKDGVGMNDRNKISDYYITVNLSDGNERPDQQLEYFSLLKAEIEDLLWRYEPRVKIYKKCKECNPISGCIVCGGVGSIKYSPTIFLDTELKDIS